MTTSTSILSSSRQCVPQISKSSTHQAKQVPGQPATQQPQGKTFTQEEFDRAVARRLRRQEAQIRGEYEPLVNVLKVGTGKEDLGEITEGLTEFYRSKGYDLQQRRTAPEYTDKDVKVLAKNDADEIIRDGDDAVAFEVDRLAKLGKKLGLEDFL